MSLQKDKKERPLRSGFIFAMPRPGKEAEIRVVSPISPGFGQNLAGPFQLFGAFDCFTSYHMLREDVGCQSVSQIY
jgi:hypothetical protein